MRRFSGDKFTATVLCLVIGGIYTSGLCETSIQDDHKKSVRAIGNRFKNLLIVRVFLKYKLYIILFSKPQFLAVLFPSG